MVQTQFSLLGKQFAAGGDLARIDFTPQGGQLAARTVVDAIRIDNPIGIPLAGSLASPSGAAASPTFNDHVEVRVNDDALNQALFAAYQGGASCESLDHTADCPPAGVLSVSPNAWLRLEGRVEAVQTGVGAADALAWPGAAAPAAAGRRHLRHLLATAPRVQAGSPH